MVLKYKCFRASMSSSCRNSCTKWINACLKKKNIGTKSSRRIRTWLDKKHKARGRTESTTHCSLQTRVSQSQFFSCYFHIRTVVLFSNTEIQGISISVFFMMLITLELVQWGCYPTRCVHTYWIEMFAKHLSCLLDTSSLLLPTLCDLCM